MAINSASREQASYSAVPIKLFHSSPWLPNIHPWLPSPLKLIFMIVAHPTLCESQDPCSDQICFELEREIERDERDSEGKDEGN
ncbi:hypothetical protein L484_022893 [Morus notabilis]|uniref:Uncharacterized protein n=1 Tax=Morus notabilis TaxID=981085 RepID=W9RSV4_9ROSA|nr:hypothetical protein L484_022893 [Morus notabilis]